MHGERSTVIQETCATRRRLYYRYCVMPDPRLTKCLTARRESKSVEFKEQFTPTDPRQSLEVLKDIVAISNSGGGALAVGINNSGNACESDIRSVLDFDHARYCDLVRKYTMQNFSEFAIEEAEKDGFPVAVFLIDPPDYSLIFEKPGQYAIENNTKQITVFGQGTIFFRHGAKTESGTTDDLRKFMHVRFREMQDQLIKGLRQVSEAPRGSELRAIPAVTAAYPGRDGVSVRITTDPGAQAAIAVDRHRVCPHRQKEVMQHLRERLPNGSVPTTHDLQAIVKLYDIGSNGQFAWKPEFSSRQYSDAFITWIVEQVKANPNFLGDARRRYYDLMHPGELRSG